MLMRPALFAFSLLCLTAHAADMPMGKNDGEPFNIEAQQSLEYQQEQRIYVARGKAKVTRGDMSVTGETLTAYERDKGGNKDNGTEVWRFTAEGDVTIANGKATAYGDKADYNIDTQYAVLTGNDLKLIAADDILTARDRFEYYSGENKAVAIGNAKAVRKSPQGTRTITADKLTAYFKKDAKGDTVADRIEAVGNVKMLSDAGQGGKPDIATARQGSYNPAANKATLTGDVKITRGPNQLSGDAAEVDTQSGVSKILSAPGATKTDGRVRGLLLPSKDTKDKTAAQ